MRKLTRADARRYAAKLMFNISDSELDNLTAEFKVMALQLEHLDKIDGIGDVEPMTFPFSNDEGVLREDEVTRTIPAEVAFSNCKDVLNGEVRVPKVVA